MTLKLEEIISKEYLNKALENAKYWCLNNLQKYIKGFQNKIKYNIFYYVIDNEMIPDMRLDEKQKGLIRVSTRALKQYQEREEYYKQDKFYSKIRGSVKVDPESMFVHEITEFILILPIFIDMEIWFSNYFGRSHETAREIENINRRGRGLKDWPKY